MKNTKQIVDQLTLEEQVSLLSGGGYWTTAAISRLGVPAVKVTDGPSGARGAGTLSDSVQTTCYPVTVALGATWNRELIREMGVSLAGQAKSMGASVLLAPTVNIQRTGVNGRNYECFSEDPALTAELATAYIEGIQSQKIAATIKHFVGNESEIDRQTMSSDIDERALREIYLYPFEQAVKKAKVMAVMSSYNKLNGIYTSENKWLLTDVLRTQWGFDGVVMSDWFGSHSTAGAIKAGLDLEMPGPTRDRGAKLVEAVKNGTVSAAVVRTSASRVIQLLDKIGALQSPPELDEKPLDLETDRSLIRRLGAEGMVLLKNDGILPLKKNIIRTLAVIGPNAQDVKAMGGGSSQLHAHYLVSPLEGLKAALGEEIEIRCAKGCENNRLVKVYQGAIRLEYFKGRNFEGTPAYVETGTKGDYFWVDMPSPLLNPENFSVRMTAQYVPEQSGKYLLGMTNAGLARLYVDNVLVINGDDGWVRGENFFSTGNNELRESVIMEAGRSYEIKVEYLSPQAVLEGIHITAIRFGIELPMGRSGFEEAVDVAKSCDVALLFVGRGMEWDTEGIDLPDMVLPGAQDELIRAVCRANPNTVVVLQTGGPVEMDWLPETRGVLQVWYPGQETGNAIADVLFGDQEPSGRLPQTFPKRVKDGPAFTASRQTYPGHSGHVHYGEGVFVGYRHYDSRKIEPLFPFGYGLGYTEFDWQPAVVGKRHLDDGRIDITIRITNIGSRVGSEVVQIYISALDSAIERPIKELKRFAKMSLAIGETGEAKFTLEARDFSYFDVNSQSFRADTGVYRIIIAKNARDVQEEIDIENKTIWIDT